MNYLGRNIKAIREYWGLSQQEFGWMIGASRGMVMQYEQRGSKPKNETVSQIVRILGISKDILFNTEIKREDFPEMSQEISVALENYRDDPDAYEDKNEDINDLLNAKPLKKKQNLADLRHQLVHGNIDLNEIGVPAILEAMVQYLYKIDSNLIETRFGVEVNQSLLKAQLFQSAKLESIMTKKPHQSILEGLNKLTSKIFDEMHELTNQTSVENADANG